MFILGSFSYVGYILFLSSSLLLLYFWLIQFIFCFVGPSLLKILFSDIVKDFSVSKVTLFPFEIRDFILNVKASKRKNRTPPITISFKRFAVFLNVYKLFYPILDLLQVLPDEYYHECDAGYTLVMSSVVPLLQYVFFNKSMRRKVNRKESVGCSESNCRLSSSAALISISISSSAPERPKPSILLETPSLAPHGHRISRTPS